MAVVSSYKALKATGSLKAFYDDIVYWEMAKNNNRFFVTFMRGEYAIPNNKQESIATAEISFPHTELGNNSTGSFGTGFNRVSVNANTFMQNIESSSVSNTLNNSHNYNGFIPVTELNGLRSFRSTITSSTFITKTYDYEVHDSTIGSTSASIEYRASYFYPFSNHQLSVLRDEPTLVLNLDKESEIPDGLGDKGFVLIPQNCHEKIKKNIEYYLEKAGLIEKTTKFKNSVTRR
tara:strand:- start:1703 stop:2404 length:702 start_codon:yes stop_codon:yes gene_type:complete